MNESFSSNKSEVTDILQTINYEKTEIDELCEHPNSCFNQPIKNYLLYKKEKLKRKKLKYKSYLLRYFPYIFYNDFFKPNFVDNFWSMLFSSIKFSLIFMFINDNEIFQRNIDRVMNFFIYCLNRVLRISN